MIYYLKRNGYIKQNLVTTMEDDTDNDGVSNFFEVRGKTIFVRLIWYSLRSGWHNEFVPVIKLESTAMCYKCIPILKDLSTAELKSMRAVYIKRYGLEE